VTTRWRDLENSDSTSSRSTHIDDHYHIIREHVGFPPPKYFHQTSCIIFTYQIHDQSWSHHSLILLSSFTTASMVLVHYHTHCLRPCAFGTLPALHIMRSQYHADSPLCLFSNTRVLITQPTRHHSRYPHSCPLKLRCSLVTVLDCCKAYKPAATAQPYSVGDTLSSRSGPCLT
jgi:hypothetical protein